MCFGPAISFAASIAGLQAADQIQLRHRVHLQATYQLNPTTRIRFDVFNLFNANANDITYYYTSRSRASRRKRGP